MKNLSYGFRALCLAVGLGAATLSPVEVWAKPAAANEADWPALRATAEPLRVLDDVSAMVKRVFAGTDWGKALSPSEHDAVEAAIKRRLGERHDELLDLIMREVFQSFSHDDIVRLAAISRSAAAKPMAEAMVQMANGADADDVSARFENDPAIAALTDADYDVLSRYMDGIVNSQAVMREGAGIIFASRDEVLNK